MFRGKSGAWGFHRKRESGVGLVIDTGKAGDWCLQFRLGLTIHLE